MDEEKSEIQKIREAYRQRSKVDPATSLYTGSSKRARSKLTKENMKQFEKESELSQVLSRMDVNSPQRDNLNKAEMRSTYKHEMFTKSIKSKYSKRGVTPGPGIALKLLPKKLGPKEKEFNIISNRGIQDHSPSSKFYWNGVLKTQNKRDYVDYTKSEFSYDYNRSTAAKKFSAHRIVRKYLNYYSQRKDHEIPPFVKEMIEDEEKLIQIVEDLHQIKEAFAEKDICLIKDGIFETLIKNFEHLDLSKKRLITHNFDSLLKNTPTPLPQSLKDQLLLKLKGLDSSSITYSRLLQFYDLSRFISLTTQPLSPTYTPTSKPTYNSPASLTTFLWSKIEEKYRKASKAFRFFDTKKRSKISMKDFEAGIEKLRIKLHKDQIQAIFLDADQDKDKYLNYMEFMKLNQNGKLKNRFAGQTTKIDVSAEGSRLAQRIKSIDSRGHNVSPKSLHDDDLSVASFYYKGYRYGASRIGRKSSRLSNYSWIDNQKHGIPSKETDDINGVMNHSYVYDNLNNEIKEKVKRQNEIKKPLCKAPTKASKLRDDYLKTCKEKLENSHNDQPKVEWKIRKFLSIGPHEDIANSIRRLKKLSPNRVLNNSSNLPFVNNQELSAAPLNQDDKKEKERLLNDYYIKKREMSSKRSNF
ncbi:unnamed protein product [Moneuplotes crassus]|uniref:EF-hand domain-containing protein n=1 Tax=Euplotes crassus TaxID=5936 RepID=A0AAD1Y9P0_EUPCR|nr:unnamed protein product [Moneuplotes crassus]